MFVKSKTGKVLTALAGSIILAFGLCNIHAFSHVTEGGSLGLCLLLLQWFHISPSVSAFIMNTACYALGFKTLGKSFVMYSVISGLGFSASYAVFERFAPLWPRIGEFPLLAAVVGGLFVGVGCGLCVRVGGAPSADDALAMSLSKLFHAKIQWIYMLSDLLVLGLSLSYIPWQEIMYSLLTVIISGQLIGMIQRFHRK